MKRMLEELFGPREPEPPTPPPQRTAPAAPKPSPRARVEKKTENPRIPVAQGYREGETFEAYVQRTRKQARARLAEVHAAQQKESEQRVPRRAKTFNLRQAVINEAVLRRPYP